MHPERLGCDVLPICSILALSLLLCHAFSLIWIRQLDSQAGRMRPLAATTRGKVKMAANDP